MTTIEATTALNLINRWDAINNPHGVTEFPAELVDVDETTYVVRRGRWGARRPDRRLDLAASHS